MSAASSIVQLVFEAVGVQPTADAVRRVTASLDDNAKTLAREGIASVAAAQAKVALNQELRRQATQQIATGAAGRSLTEKLRDMSAVVTDKLIPSLDPAAKQLLALGAGMLSARVAYNALKGTINNGADLYYLSLRTGESIRSLVVQEQAFRNTGLGATYLGTAINLLDRALSPTAESAKTNERMFRQLGLSIDDLRAEDFAGRIKTLSAAFAALPNQAERAAIAMQIFGRYAGGKVLQLFNDPTAMAVAEQQAGRYGDYMQANAKKFADLQQQIHGVQVQFKLMSAAALEQLVPALQSVRKHLGGIGGAGIGSIFGLAGPTAAGGLAAMWGVDKLDQALNRAADNFKGNLKGTLLGAAKSTSNALATWLPVGLAGLIAIEIVAGIAQAIQNEEWDKVRADIAAAIKTKEAGTQKLGAVSTATEATTLATDLRSQITELEKQRTFLHAQLAQAPEYLAATSKLRSSGTWAESTIAQYASRSYQGTDGQDRNYENDQSARIRLDQQLATLRAQEDKVRGTAQVAKLLIENDIAAWQRSVATLVDQLPANQDKLHDIELAGMAPEQRLTALQRDRSAIAGELANIPGAANDTEREAKTADIKVKLAAIDKEIADANKKIADEKKRAADEDLRRQVYVLETRRLEKEAAGDTAGAQLLKAEIDQKQTLYGLSELDLQMAQDRLTVEHSIWEQQEAQRTAIETQQKARDALQNTLAGIRSNIAKLEADYTHTDTEKWAARRAAVEQQIAAIATARDRDRALSQSYGASGDDVSAKLYADSADKKGGQLAGAQTDLARLGPDPASFSAQMLKASSDIRGQMRTVAQSIGETWRNLGITMRTSMGTALFDMLNRTKNFKDAAGSFFLSLGQSLARSLTQMVADWTMSHLIMYNVQKLFHALGFGDEVKHQVNKTIIVAAGETGRTSIVAAGEGAQTGIVSGAAATQTAATAPAAIMHSIMQLGPIAGPVVMAASIAAMLALVQGISRRELGGPVEAGTPYLVGEKRAEIFVPHSDGFIHPDASSFSLELPAPRRGRGGFGHSMSSAAPPSSMGGVSGGGGTGGRDSARNTHIYLDRSAWLDAVQNDLSGIAHEIYDRRARA